MDNNTSPQPDSNQTNQAPVATPPPITPTEPPKDNSKKTILIILAILAVIILAPVIFAVIVFVRDATKPVGSNTYTKEYIESQGFSLSEDAAHPHKCPVAIINDTPTFLYAKNAPDCATITGRFPQ